VNDTRFPQIAVSLGDPAGIGTEVVLKALADLPIAVREAVTIVGNRILLNRTYQALQQVGCITLASPNELNFLDVGVIGSEIAEITPGEGSAASGAVSFRYLETAIAATVTGRFQAIATAPIAKSAWKAAGYSYPGQTELLAERSASQRFGMAFVARSPHTNWTLRTLLATTHIPLREVPDTLTPELLTTKLELLIDWLQQDWGLSQPRIAVAGLNPHSGEQGQLGHEEQTWMQSWLEAMSDRFPKISLDGLTPPDTLWVKPGQAWRYSHAVTTAHDAYLALYHDQGLIPVKLLAFDQAVNTSIGLPFIRTSPDHGTAFDIAHRGIANASSMKAAIQLAYELAGQRQQLKFHSRSNP
jgi:4-hydroxythreonine-4-phosphate dehydrogenase